MDTQMNAERPDQKFLGSGRTKTVKTAKKLNGHADERRKVGSRILRIRRYGTTMISQNADFKHRELTQRVIKAFYTVYNSLGYGFLEKIYENALLIELAKRNIPAIAQNQVQVFYDGKIVGEYFADILVDNCLVAEIKATKNLILEHEAQLLNYLKATNLEVGLLLNFGPKPEIRRKAFDNQRKNHANMG